MWPLSAEVPKGLLPLVGIPFVDHQVARLAAAGVTEVILAVDTDHLTAWEEYAAGVSDLSVRLSVEHERLDTGGPVRALLEDLDDLFFVLNGDVVVDTDLAALAAAAPGDAAATLALIEVEDTSAYGVVVTDDRGLVERFVEKPDPSEAPARTVNAGVYVMRPHAISGYDVGALSFERTVFPDLVASGGLAGVVVEGAWIDIGTPPLYLDTHHQLLVERSTPHVAPPAVDASGEWAWIAADASIAPGARVADSVVLGGAVVEEGAVVERAIIGWGARVGAGAVVTGDTLVGARAQIGVGCELTHGMRIGPDAVLGERAVTFRPPD